MASFVMTRRRLGWLMGLLACAAVVGQPNEAPPAPKPDEIRFEGIVVDHVGAGITDAQVRIESPDASADDPPLAEGVSTSRGQIAITMKRPALERVRVRVTREGYAQYVGELDISDPDEPPFIDATLTGAARVEGRVRDAATGRPLADAKLQCSNGGRRLAARTGSDGAYAIKFIYQGPAVVTADLPGYAIQRQLIQVVEDRHELDFQLEPERPIELTIVTNTNEPAEDVFIEAIGQPGPVRTSASSDASGRAVLHGIGADCEELGLRFNGERYLSMRGYDEYLRLLTIRAPQGAAATRPAPVRARFTVTLAARLRGRVVDKATNRPVPGARLSAGREPRYDMPVDWTGGNGAYELVGVRPGIVTVTVQHEGYAAAFHSVDLHTGKSGTLDVALERGVAIGGIVVDEHGTPLDQVRVSGDGWRVYGTLGLRAVTGADGRFTFAHVPLGEIRFSFVRPGYGEPQRVVLAAGRTDHRVVLEGAASPPASAPDMADRTKLKPGQPVPDLTMTATDGTVYKLSELRGKYVFLDCWASWCGPCMHELPNVKAVREATKDREDFVMIGISLDTDAKALQKACKEHGLTWPQVFGPKSGASEAFEELDGVGIPYICLIGPDGKLIAQHLRGPAMVGEVKKTEVRGEK
ncbi:MAG: carboxypeptidase regulatory-like domain-containing protein [Planctomycetes bacterium]|nr:carboxypeptidase regulatory-like domain-containing protein [Planctomycetota bacterium]